MAKVAMERKDEGIEANLREKWPPVGGQYLAPGSRRWRNPLGGATPAVYSGYGRQPLCLRATPDAPRGRSGQSSDLCEPLPKGLGLTSIVSERQLIVNIFRP